MSASLAALWPPPAVVTAVRGLRVAEHHYLAVPSATSPRLLVPSGVPGAGRMLARHGGGRRTRVLRRALRLAHSTGLSSWAPMPRLRVVRDPSGIESHLESVLDRPVRVGVLLGPPRANLKPVLQVFAADGSVLAFAKVATSSVTEPLLRNEAAALERLALRPVPGVTVPALLDLGTWRGLPVLVQGALPSAQSGRQPRELPVTALAAIAAADGLHRGPLAGSAFWRDVAEDLPSSWNGVDVSGLSRLRDAVDTGDDCVFGAWHGDFAPWNAAEGGRGLEVWDWERFETGVPVGLDAAHWRVQLDVGTDPEVAWRAVCRDVDAVLTEGAQRADASVVAACYLLAVWARYRHDAPADPTPALRARVTWLCSLAEVGAATIQEVRR